MVLNYILVGCPWYVWKQRCFPFLKKYALKHENAKTTDTRKHPWQNMRCMIYDFNVRRKAKPTFTLYGIVFRGAKTAIRYSMNGNDPWLHKSFTHIEHRGSALVNIRRKALSSLMIFTQGRTLLCFYLTLKWYFKLEIIQESASLFNLKEKKNWYVGQED